MKLGDYVSYKVFIVSFLVGLLCVYLLPVELDTVLVYPSPDNYKNIMYKDGSGACFRLDPSVAECGSNPFSPPIQHAVQH